MVETWVEELGIFNSENSNPEPGESAEPLLTEEYKTLEDELCRLVREKNNRHEKEPPLFSGVDVDPNDPWPQHSFDNDTLYDDLATMDSTSEEDVGPSVKISRSRFVNPLTEPNRRASH